MYNYSLYHTSLCLANMYITMQLTQWFQPQVITKGCLSVTLSQYEGCLYTKCQKHGYVSHLPKPFVPKPPRHNPSQVPISSKTQLAPRGLRLTLKSCSLFLDFNLFSLLLCFSMTQRKQIMKYWHCNFEILDSSGYVFLILMGTYSIRN